MYRSSVFWHMFRYLGFSCFIELSRAFTHFFASILPNSIQSTLAAVQPRGFPPQSSTSSFSCSIQPKRKPSNRICVTSNIFQQQPLIGIFNYFVWNWHTTFDMCTKLARKKIDKIYYWQTMTERYNRNVVYGMHCVNGAMNVNGTSRRGKKNGKCEIVKRKIYFKRIWMKRHCIL